MASVTIAMLARAPREAVFAAFTDFAGRARVVEGVSAVVMLTDGPVGVGTRFRETRVMFGREATEELWVSAFAPPERLVLSAHSHGTDYESVFVFAEEGSGARVTHWFTARPRTLAAWAMAPLGLLMVRSVRRMLAADMADIVRHVEGSG